MEKSERVKKAFGEIIEQLPFVYLDQSETTEDYYEGEKNTLSFSVGPIYQSECMEDYYEYETYFKLENFCVIALKILEREGLWLEDIQAGLEVIKTEKKENENGKVIEE